MLDLQVVHRILREHGGALSARVPGFRVGDVELDFASKRYLVGVINLSTDSWYKESVCRTAEEGVARGRQLLAEGATIIDIGAESTLPDAERKSIDAQIDMLLPVVEPLVAEGGLVSVESYHPEVLSRCAEAGAQIFNLTGMREADEVFDVAARFGAAVILCYVEGETVREVGDFTLEDDMVPRLLAYFRELLARAEAKGVTKCFVDPGLGFYYKNLQDSSLRVTHQMNTFLNAFRMAELGKPVFNILPHAPEAFKADRRREAESFFAVLALLAGTHVIRTHEVDRVKRVVDAMEMYGG
jgi:dihydropteroate synthase